MTEAGIRTRRNFPAETWAVVRDAYLGGETAESIEKRLGISVNTIRKRASRCGWTHVAHARALARIGDGEAESNDLEPDLDPHEALTRATRHAARLLAQGRGTEAAALVKAAQGLADLFDRHFSMPPQQQMPVPTDAQLDELEEELKQSHHKRLAREYEAMVALAEALMADRVPQDLEHAALAYHWRAANRGADVAAADLAHARAGGWADPYWDEGGYLRPLSAAFDAQWDRDLPDFRMRMGIRNRG